jgi:hypothetical protein
MQIEVSLDVYKALTDRLQHEKHTYGDVIRDLLELDSPQELQPSEPSSGFSHVSEAIARAVGYVGFYSRGLQLPEGTSLRSRYKQKEYRARIIGDRWIDENKKAHSSPSAAASAITGNNVNGLRFWEALRPGDKVWRRLDTLV